VEKKMATTLTLSIPRNSGGSFNNPTFTGTVTAPNTTINAAGSTVNGPLTVAGPSLLLDSNTAISPGHSLDLTGVTVVGLTPSFNNTTLTGTTAVSGPLNVNGNSTFAPGTTLSLIGVNVVGLTLSGVTLTGTTTIGGQLNVTGASNFSGGVTVAPGTTLDVTGANVTGLSLNNVALNGLTTINSMLAVPAVSTFSGGLTVSPGTTLDLTGVNVVGLAPSFNNVTLTGTTNITGTLTVPAPSSFTGGVTLASGTTLDLTGVTVLGLAPSFNNVTLTGTTTVNGTAMSVNVPSTFSNGVTLSSGTTLDLTGVNVVGLTLASTTFTNATLNGTTTVNGTLNVPAVSTFSGGVTLASGTTLDLTGVTVIGMAPSYNNVTLTGTTTITGTLNVPAPSTFTGGVTLQSGTTLDLTGVTVLGLAPSFNNVTLTGTTTVNGTAMNVNVPSTFSNGVTLSSGTTLDLTGVTVIGLAPSYNNVTLTGTTTITGTLNVPAPSTFTGGVTLQSGTTLDLTGVNVLGFVPSTPSLTLTPTNPNPGGATTIWADSANANTVRYGNAFFGLSAGNSVQDVIYVASNTIGGMSTALTNVTASLRRPLLVTAGNSAGNLTVMTTTSVSNRSVNIFQNANGTSTSVSIQMGSPLVVGTSLTWTLLTDSTSSLANDFSIIKNSGAVTGTVLFINDAGTVNFLTASTNGLVLPTVASAPVVTGSTILWSSASSVVRVNVAGNIALVGDVATTANAIPVYSNTTGRVDTASTATAATLARPITVTSTTTTAAIFNAVGTRGSIVIGSDGTNPLMTFGGATTPYQIGSSGDNFYITKVGSAAALIVNALGSQLVYANFGFTSGRYDILQTTSNPGGATTVWSNANDTVTPGNPYWGIYPIVLRPQLIESFTSAIITSSTSVSIQFVWTRLRFFVYMSVANPAPLSPPQLTFPPASVPAIYRPTIRNVAFAMGATTVSTVGGSDDTSVVVGSVFVNGAFVLGVNSASTTLAIVPGTQGSYCIDQL
jgi:hypothetical protein